MPKAFEYYQAFDKAAAVGDIQATIDHVRKDAGCNGKVGAVGFCLGGHLAVLTALKTDADASVSYYGVGLETLADQAGAVKSPLILHIAEEDGFVPKPAQQTIKAAFGANPKVTIYSYPGRDHAFARPGGDHFHAADANLAGERTLALFKETIG